MVGRGAGAAAGADFGGSGCWWQTPRAIQKLRLCCFSSAMLAERRPDRAPQPSNGAWWGLAHPDRARTLVTELISLAPDVIVAHGTPALTALHRATRTIPVVFVSISISGAGYVQSSALPGGNTTGSAHSSLKIGGKWLDLRNQASAAGF